METTLPAKVVDDDHRLEKDADRASDALAKHRWHWTLDASNPDRVSFTDYAKAIGRNRKAVAIMANAYQATAEDQSSARSLQDEVQLQSVKEADRDLVEETAKGLKISVVNTRQHHKDVVSRVRDAVADLDEQEPNATPERRREVARRTARNIRKSREVERAGREQLKRNAPAQAVLVDGELTKAKLNMVAALNYAKDVDPATFPSELLEHMQRTLDDVQSVLGLVRSALGGAANVDWDAELRKLEVS